MVGKGGSNLQASYSYGKVSDSPTPRVFFIHRRMIQKNLPGSSAVFTCLLAPGSRSSNNSLPFKVALFLSDFITHVPKGLLYRQIELTFLLRLCSQGHKSK